MVSFLGLCCISVSVYMLIEKMGNIMNVFRYIGNIWKVLMTGIICVYMSCARPLLYLLYFGKLFKRVESNNEKIAVSWQYLKTSATEMVKTLIDCDNMFTYEGNIEALNMDMGMVGVAFCFLIFFTMICLFMYWKKSDKNLDNSVRFLLDFNNT